ncbi:MAG: hypothetical protein RL711_1309 [Bacteroidota bacterium]|jgi:hypothetical protein
MTQIKKKIALAHWYRKLVTAKNNRASLRRLAKTIAEAITTKKIPANEGANIMWCIWERLHKPAYLAPFVGLASEYKDYEFLQQYVDRSELHQIISYKVDCLSDIIHYSSKMSTQQ